MNNYLQKNLALSVQVRIPSPVMHDVLEKTLVALGPYNWTINTIKEALPNMIRTRNAILSGDRSANERDCVLNVTNGVNLLKFKICNDGALTIMRTYEYES